MNHLFNLLKSGKTQFHVVKECIDYLSREGFKMLSLSEDWDIKPNGKYMVSPYSSMLISFVIGGNPKNLRLAAAHTDFPMLKLKPNNEIIKKGYLQANIETYGGLIKETWFDSKKMQQYFNVEIEEKAAVAACASGYFEKYNNIPEQLKETSTKDIVDAVLAELEQRQNQRIEAEKAEILADLDMYRI